MAYTTINKSTDFFNTTLRNGVYGTSGTTTDITVGFRPDLVWNKVRNSTGNHDLIDSVRGGGYLLKANATDAQAVNANVTSFLSNGFQITNNNDWNTTNTLVDWSWKAGGASSSNTDGSINSTVSANTTAGFSIVSYTGTGSNATVGHGLGAVPKMIIAKKINGSTGWRVYHHGVGATKSLFLDSNDVATTSTAYFNDTSPTSSVFSIGTNSGINPSGDTYIAYCFAEKTGYSKFGSYTGNGQTGANAPFIYTGFKPAFVIIKRTNSAKDWFMWDNKTSSRNPTNYYLRPNTNQSEGSYDWLDFVSNGIKIRNTSDGANGSGDTYIYMAFGQSLVGSNNVPCTAR